MQQYEKIIKLFDSFGGTRSGWEVWNDFITLTAISLSNIADAGRRRVIREKEYCSIVKKYSQKEVQTIMQIFSELILEYENNSEQDVLGSLYMLMEFGSGKLGQFFTPYHLCALLCETGYDENTVQAEIKQRGFTTMYEPACGAGANIIAFANKLKKEGVDFQRKLFVVAQDLSKVTALMCYLQLSILGIPGVVIIGDSLNTVGGLTVEMLYDSENVWVTPTSQLYSLFK